MKLLVDNNRLRIGQVASAASVNIQTIRYYERRGLLKAVPRRPSGYREYPYSTIRLIRFIKRAQELGFSLVEIEELLRLHDDTTSSCKDVRSVAGAKIIDIDSKVENLKAMRRALAVLVRSCTGNGSTRTCPILEALDNEQRKGKAL